MRIVLTGVAGFIGSNLAYRLLQEGHTVIGVDNFATGSMKNVEQLLDYSRFRFIEHDVVNPLEIDGDINWVMHFASPASPPKYLELSIETLRVNSEGTMHLLTLAKNKKASFFLASTSEIYGDPMVHPQPETYYGNVNSFGVRSCYDEGKRYAEAMTYTMHKKYNIPIRIIRIFNTYGPNMDISDGRVVTNFIKQIIEKKPLTIYGNGEQTRSFQYIDDLVNGIVKLMDTNYNSTVNLGNPEEYTILELAQMIEELAGSSMERNFLPAMSDDPMQRKPDITVAKKLLDWEPKTQVKDGLMKTMAYFKNENVKEVAKTTLIVYASKYGTTKEWVHKLAINLEGDVNIIPSKDVTDNAIALSDRLIIASPVYAGQLLPDIISFCKDNVDVIKNKEVGLLIGGMDTEDKAYDNISRLFPKEILDKKIIKAHMGGNFIFDKMNKMDKGIIQKMTGLKENVYKVQESRLEEFANSLNSSIK